MAKLSAIDACIAYDSAARRIRDLTRLIGESLELCPITKQANTPDARGYYPDNLMDGGRIKTHLWHAFRETTDADAPYPSERHLVDWELEEYLEEQGCPHCVEAWRLVKERKAARRAFGLAKRNVRMIGRRATP